MTIRKIFILWLAVSLCLPAGLAEALSQKEIKQDKAQLTKLQKEINRLKSKLKTAKAKRLRADVIDKIKVDQAKLTKIKKILYPKPPVKPPLKGRLTKQPAPEEVVTPEVGPEETTEAVSKKEERKAGVFLEAGAVTGIFSNANVFLGEVRIPLRVVFGPAIAALRVSTGLAQSTDMTRRYIPFNLDMIFNFPPGWFSGVENYLGAGVNYVALTSGHQAGTFGGQAFYGVQSEGFGGIVFGELGYGLLRTGFSPSNKGVTVLVGYRLPIRF